MVQTRCPITQFPYPNFPSEQRKRTGKLNQKSIETRNSLITVFVFTEWNNENTSMLSLKAFNEYPNFSQIDFP